ncbi:ATP-dependent helicase [Mycetocola reblochoni]|uniref:DNA 3'-5' helicase n=1 Tax=Mycetocola reblochoni TaxID=331618 RepID=A0A3L6ZRD8_9MICO|nr:ATP-dependent helicase [Mycetocola reblochoni]
MADALGLPSPTPQQRRVIEAPLTPALVVAGAGSGKTETMANRIVWLLANGHVRVPEVLGLTFTRKAAGELQERVIRRVEQLGARLGGDDDVLATATISTYNSFASGLYREYARTIGREPDATVITEASAWRLARDVVVAGDDPLLVELDAGIDSITDAVLRLAHHLSDNDVLERADDVVAYAERFATVASLPIDNPRKRTDYASVVSAARDVGALPMLVRMAEEFHRRKLRRGLLEFSDQIALAQRIVRRFPRARAEYRSRYRVVILDEYQDTSVVQTRLLSELFHAHPVMAVGDPNQSIYGWRGASASNISRFPGDFGGDAGANAFALSVSWRNSSDVLDVANAIVDGLPAIPGIPVEALEPSPLAAAGRIDIAYPETVQEEADAVARWFAGELARPSASGGQRTAALLCRSVKRSRLFTEALARAGVPTHVLGLTGLLEHPAVVDAVAALRVMHDPTAGADLVRLLTGARWRLGVADVDALAATARWLGGRDAAQQPLPESSTQALRRSTASDDGSSLVDALDALLVLPDDHVAVRAITAEGRERMRDLARVLQGLRRRTGSELVDTVTSVIAELRLDIEVLANAEDTAGQESLDAFVELADGFRLIAEQATLGPFLAWLDDAERRERLSPAGEPAEPGTVQVLTIHGAKGLEWDSVAVPRLVTDELPSPLRSARGWTALGELPYDFAGDREDLPVLDWADAVSQREFDEAMQRFGDGLAERNGQEQRRLAYVAVTRARDALLLSGSFWSSQKTPRSPSRYLVEAAEALGRGGELPAESSSASHPAPLEGRSVLWPTDPLGGRGTAVRSAAQAVSAARGSGARSRWDEDIELLLAERSLRHAGEQLVPVPERIAASRFKDFVADTEATARALRRPLPEKPYRQTRLGTLFHSWVEERSTARPGGMSDLLDLAEIERDDAEEATGTLVPMAEADRRRLEELQRTFERSEWAELAPLHVELEINVVFDGRVVICKLDAVYRRQGRIQIVDWKTGAVPKDAEQLHERQLQLALYRLAYARWSGEDADDIDAVFYYVADDVVIRPDRIDGEEELLVLWRGIGAARG